MPQSIRDIHFHNARAPRSGVEVLTLESLFQRGLNQLLETPQRVHFYHVILMTGGAGEHTLDFTRYPYDADTLLLVSQGQVQQFHVNPAASGYLILFTPDFIYQNATELNLFHSLQVFDHALFSPRIQLTADQHARLLHLCQIMQDESHQPIDDLTDEIMRQLLRVFLLHVERIRRVNPISRQAAPLYQDLVAFRRLVERDLAQSRSVQYYARQLAVSTKKLNDLTRRLLNQTAKDFIEAQIILEAQRRLAYARTPIKEIAYQLGFSDPGNLIKFFKKHTRLSPAAFRRQFQPD